MPRIRTIKPQFWLDEQLGSIPRDARLLYIGIWNLCDDTGVFEFRPAKIKIQIFPYDSDITADDISKWLELLRTTGDIKVFNVNGSTFGYVPSFLKHQEIKHPSKWKYAEIPMEFMANESNGINNLPITPSSPTPDIDVPYETNTTNLVLSLGSREKEKEKEKEKESSASKKKVSDEKLPELPEIVKIYEEEFKQPITPLIADDLKDIEKEYGVEIFRAACKKASVKRLNYIRPIMEDYKKNGIPEKFKNTQPSARGYKYVN